MHWQLLFHEETGLKLLKISNSSNSLNILCEIETNDLCFPLASIFSSKMHPESNNLDLTGAWIGENSTQPLKIFPKSLSDIKSFNSSRPSPVSIEILCSGCKLFAGHISSFSIKLLLSINNILNKRYP